MTALNQEPGAEQCPRVASHSTFRKRPGYFDDWRPTPLCSLPRSLSSSLDTCNSSSIASVQIGRAQPTIEQIADGRFIDKW